MPKIIKQQNVTYELDSMDMATLFMGGTCHKVIDRGLTVILKLDKDFRQMTYTDKFDEIRNTAQNLGEDPELL